MPTTTTIATNTPCEEGIEPLSKEITVKEEVHLTAEEDYDEEAQLRLAIENSLKDMVGIMLVVAYIQMNTEITKH